MPEDQERGTGRLRSALEELEKSLIVEALTCSRGRLNEAAAYLGITTRIMGLRVRKYRLDRRRYRFPAGSVSLARGR